MMYRILEKSGTYTPQHRMRFSPFWFDITDTQFEEALENEDDFDFDPEEAAISCARRYAGTTADIPVVYYEGSYWTQIKRALFSRFTGEHGQPGMQGPEGARGKPGNVTDVQCPHCDKHRTDYPAQAVMFEVLSGGKFQYHCNKCKKYSVWLNFDGLLLPRMGVKNKAE